MGGSKSKRGGGDRVLESRHLVGLFLGVVLLCCVFFTLGYVMGRTQYGNTPVQAASLEKTSPNLHPAPPAAAATQPPSSPEWDFYTEKKTTDVPLKPAPPKGSRHEATTAAAIRTAPAAIRTAPAVEKAPAPVREKHEVSLPSARYRPPRIPHGAIVLQVGALRSESDALAMADALQQKGYPAFVLTPTADSFYRVQVGPFSSPSAGDKAKQALQREGFKSIYKR